MIIYVVFVYEEILTAFYADFFQIYPVLMLISTAILKIMVKSLYDFRNLDH